MLTFKSFINEELVQGGFNIFRNQMPQLNDLEAFKSLLDTHGLKYTETPINPSELKPTQKDIDVGKVMNITDYSKPIIVSGVDFYILDGHHRFYAAIYDKAPLINVIQVDAPINVLLHITKDMRL